MLEIFTNYYMQIRLRPIKYANICINTTKYLGICCWNMSKEKTRNIKCYWNINYKNKSFISYPSLELVTEIFYLFL